MLSYKVAVMLGGYPDLTLYNVFLRTDAYIHTYELIHVHGLIYIQNIIYFGVDVSWMILDSLETEQYPNAYPCNYS